MSDSPNTAPGPSVDPEVVASAPSAEPQPEPQPASAPPAAPAAVQPAYPAPNYPVYAPQPPTNTLAILALVLSFVISIAGIVLGHMALGQIRQTGERGRELAIAGLVIGYVITGFYVLFIVAYVIFAIVGLSMMGILWGTLATTS